MTKRATNKDVAKLAGVSVTTVSYVINGRDEEMHISPATKKKVLQAVNFLGYSPNPFAASLKNNPARGLAVRASAQSCFLQDIEAMFLSRDLNDAVKSQSYFLSFLPDTKPEKLAFEACICYNMSREEFHALGQENFIPLIAVDSLIDDPVFYQVTPDYAKMKATADAHFNAPYLYIAAKSADKTLEELIAHTFPNLAFVSNLAEALSLDIKGKNILLTQPSLFQMFEQREKECNLFRYETHLKARSEIILNCVKNAVGRVVVEDNAHYVRI